MLAAVGFLSYANNSFSQGYVVFSSYSANFPTGALTFTDVANGNSLYADLFYAFGTVSDPVNLNSSVSITSNPAFGFTDLGLQVSYMPLSYYGMTYDSDYNGTGGTVSGYEGYFDGGEVTIPGYVSGPITFEVVAFSGSSSYGSSQIRGRSGSFTMNSIAASLPVPYFGDNGQPMPDFAAGDLGWTPQVVPEPCVLSLVGLGGLFAFNFLRRRK